MAAGTCYNASMTSLPEPCPLPRLDTPAKQGPWRWLQWFRSKAGRRQQFRWTMNNSDLSQEERVARLRTLIDLGLWGDHITEAEESARLNPGKGLLSQLRYALGAMFAPSPSQWYAMSEKAMRKEQNRLAIALFLGSSSRVRSTEFVHLALEAGMDITWHENNNSDDNLLTLYARKGALEQVKLLLAAGVDPYWRDSCNETPLILALRGMEGQHPALYRQMADAMVAAGVDINSSGPPRRFTYGGGPPLKAALEKAPNAGVAWLIANGVNPSAQDDDGGGLAHWLADTYEVDLAQEEKRFGVVLDFDAANDFGQTPLWIAIKAQNREVADQLIARGARLDVQPDKPHRHDSYDQDGNGQAPRRGKSLPQVLIETHDRDDWASDLARVIHQKHPECWNWPTPWDTPLGEWISTRSNGQDWAALAQEVRFEAVTEPAQAPSRPGRRL